MFLASEIEQVWQNAVSPATFRLRYKERASFALTPFPWTLSLPSLSGRRLDPKQAPYADCSHVLSIEFVLGTTDETIE